MQFFYVFFLVDCIFLFYPPLLKDKTKQKQHSTSESLKYKEDKNENTTIQSPS